MNQFGGILNRVRDVLYEPLAKIILSYTRFFKDLMKVFANINSYVSKYYIPRTFAQQMAFPAPIERVREEAFEPLQKIGVQPRISYTINLLRRIIASRQATVSQDIVKSVEVPEGLSEAYKIMGESASQIMQLEKSLGQYTIGRKVSREAAEIEYTVPEHVIGEKIEFREKMAPETRAEGEARAVEEKMVPQLEVIEKPAEVGEREKMVEIRQEWSEPFKYIGNLMNVLTQLGSQLPVTRYFVPTKFMMPEEVFKGYYMFSPLKEAVERLESANLTFIQALAQKTFTEPGTLEEGMPVVKEMLEYPVSEYKSILLAIPYILSYYMQVTRAPRFQETFSKTLSYSLQQTYSRVGEEMRVEAIRSAFTSTPLTHYMRLLDKGYPFYIYRAPEIAYMLTYPYIGSSMLAEAYKQIGGEYVREHATYKVEEFAGKAVFTKVLNILETLPALVQETEAVKYVGLEAYYPLATMSKNFLQNLIQLYDRLLYEVKVVRPSEASPMVTAASQYLETARIFRMAEEEARRETLPSALRQAYTIQPAHPSQTLMEREIQNIFNITVPEGAEVDMWELERKITQILREQFRRYYGPTF